MPAGYLSASIPAEVRVWSGSKFQTKNQSRNGLCRSANVGKGGGCVAEIAVESLALQGGFIVKGGRRVGTLQKMRLGCGPWATMMDSPHSTFRIIV